jgi:hypothetical protein
MVITGTTNFATVSAPLTRAKNCRPNQLTATNTAMNPMPSSTPSPVSDVPL